MPDWRSYAAKGLPRDPASQYEYFLRLQKQNLAAALMVGAYGAGSSILRPRPGLRPSGTLFPPGYIGADRQLPYHGPILGGSYRDVRLSNIGGDFHHMPADSASPLPRDLGPGILMDTPDHAQTLSFGGSRAANAYRQRQRQLIQQGRFPDAVNMDIDNIRGLFGDRYDDHIRQMLDWIKLSRTVR